MHSALYDIYALYNIHNGEYSNFVRIFKFKISKKEEQNIIYNMPFTICISQYIKTNMH